MIRRQTPAELKEASILPLQIVLRMYVRRARL